MDGSGREMHPAVAAALSVMPENDGRARLVGSVIREEDGAVAVVVHTARWRYVVVVLRDGDRWITPTLIIGEGIPTQPRLATNFPTMPLAKQSADIRNSLHNDFVWHAVVGTAALDADSVRVVTTLESRKPEIGDDGLVLALVRAQHGERPLVTVTTRDGREESNYQED
ncbi:hypothetical protein H0264_28850 [Nocardia huaxiensis]|uniref:Uncharacterized protein n=1 Tax=Nocardia huaxiensis TaxID=2755382 RepID=A0A7D6ZET6_9NOCA|nr:hypothetical protein [Nocardia huaxiensis]QLY29259.1 hypothetical protein H0264_28850 [Nocardia huaxiensis]